MATPWFPTGWFPSGWFPDVVDYYTRGSYINLPTDDADLVTPYTDADYTAVLAVDGSMVAQTATSGFAIQAFKIDATGKNTINIEWDGQTNLACSISPVYLQIYNVLDAVWQNLAFDNSTGINTNINLSAPMSPLDNYKDNNIITVRVYQEVL